MNPYVVDTSVAVKWVFEEKGSENAALFLEEFEQKKIQIIVPEFFYCELASACLNKFLRKLATFGEADERLARVADLPLTTYPDRELADVAFENAVRLNISVYDALYLALAEIYVAPLVTADGALLKACRGRFDFIESLEEFAEEKR